MADNNNDLAGSIPATPNPKLKALDRLVGTWDVTGSFITGTAVLDWMEGGYFLVQKVDFTRDEHAIRGVEYIGFDEDTQTLRSHYMDNNGSNFTYTWEIDGDTIRIYFGDTDSDNFFEGTFSEDGKSYRGKWQWPGGGYEATMTKRQ